ncbi:hypothetical protein [Moorella sulfitireducens (nom. illeg.)]|uniref:hypothetical protein n=1 Tax=Neomoorella sulfitireducens TaxID=2972948 RepID=UPI0021ABC6BA|nr:hypothetical protein [Moorella sulfitireducens]
MYGDGTIFSLLVVRDWLAAGSFSKVASGPGFFYTSTQWRSIQAANQRKRVTRRWKATLPMARAGCVGSYFFIKV